MLSIRSARTAVAASFSRPKRSSSAFSSASGGCVNVPFAVAAGFVVAQ
jgi:hypothetical protein